MTPYYASLLSVAKTDLQKAEDSIKSLEAQIAKLHEHQTEIMQVIKILSPDLKGLSPDLKTFPNVLNIGEINYNEMTIRQSSVTYFLTNGNEPTHYKTLSEATGKSKSSVASILSASPEFIRSHEGHWMLAPNYYNHGWTTVGK